MQSMRTLTSRLRLAMAGLFAVISLLQTPSMVFAWSDAAPTHHADSTISHVHHGAMQLSHEHDSQDTGDASYNLPACHVVGCCIGLDSGCVGAPAALYHPLGLVDTAPTRTMTPASPEPADPPPRLQA